MCIPCIGQVGRDTVCCLLLQHGAPVNSVEEGNDTPMHHAAERRHDRVAVLAVLLLQHGALLPTVEGVNMTPLHWQL